MKNLLDKILSKLRDENKSIRMKVQPQEGDWVTIGFYINYEQRIALINSIENKAEIPSEFLYALAEAIRNKELTRDSWIEEERAYYERMAKLAFNPPIK